MSFKQIADNFKHEFGSAGRIISNIIDILLVAFMLYCLFLFLKRHNCSRLIKFVVPTMLGVALLGSDALGLHMIGHITAGGIIILTIALVLLFPQEMRRTLWKISSPKTASAAYTTGYECSDEELREAVSEIVRATQNMAKKDVGALIVIAPKEAPFNVLESGTKLDAVLTSPLLESIFNTKAPLHDGAVFIRGNRIMAAGCFLPLTQDGNLDKELGTRHRAAIGISETNSVVVIIVSEETGIISVAAGGELTRYYDSPMLLEKLEQVYGLRASDEGQKKLRKRKKV